MRKTKRRFIVKDNPMFSVEETPSTNIFNHGNLEKALYWSKELETNP